jgi:hypothetical protein
VQCSTSHYITAQHSTAQHSTAQHSIAQHSTAQALTEVTRYVSPSRSWTISRRKYRTAICIHIISYHSTAQYSTVHCTNFSKLDSYIHARKQHRQTPTECNTQARTGRGLTSLSTTSAPTPTCSESPPCPCPCPCPSCAGALYSVKLIAIIYISHYCTEN